MPPPAPKTTVKSRILGPGDLPGCLESDVFTVVQETGGPGQPKVNARPVNPSWELLGSLPNAHLVWRRYLPCHLKTETGDAASSWFGLEEVSKGQFASTLVGRRAKALDDQRTRWSGYGSLSWFAAQAKCPLPHEDLDRIRKRRTAALGKPSLSRNLTTLRRLAVGIGNPANYENAGIAFEPVYGFPIVPGSSLKGLLRHWLDEQGGAQAALATRLCGREASGGDQGEEGALVFLDAWPSLSPDQSPFEVDILAPHQKEWMDSGGSGSPSDSGKLTLIHWLAVRKGLTFSFALGVAGPSRRHPNAAQWLDEGWKALEQALKTWGIGARTSAGYGLFK